MIRGALLSRLWCASGLGKSIFVPIVKLLDSYKSTIKIIMYNLHEKFTDALNDWTNLILNSLYSICTSVEKHT
jgi:hypothetical protein